MGLGAMIGDRLTDTVKLLLADDKGLLAMDESTGTCNKRFASVGVEQTEEMRRRYRELIITTPGLASCVSGVILYDETIRQSRADGASFVETLAEVGILPGIKLDAGAKGLAGHPGEQVTEGLDGLRERIQAYFKMGARFAKWRAVIGLGQGLPSEACIEANAHALARYAALCQEGGLVPIVEPEVLMEGDHDIATCANAMERVLRGVFAQLANQGVALDAMILKPNMALPGLAYPTQPPTDEVARMTVDVLRRWVPAEVPGVAFLSGGQSGELASARLSAMNRLYRSPSARAPWALTFSYARAIQQPALETWAGKDANREAAQHALLHRAECNRAARQGRYDISMESKAP
jgi:fructose-bisphosphate aldolase class I